MDTRDARSLRASCFRNKDEEKEEIARGMERRGGSLEKSVPGSNYFFFPPSPFSPHPGRDARTAGLFCINRLFE